MINEIFLYFHTQTVQHGFPHKPTALAYDPIDQLMAIGTHSGAIKIFGQPGVEFYGQHPPPPAASAAAATNNAGAAASPNNVAAAAADGTAVQLLAFVTGTGRLLSLTTANQLVLWEPAGHGALVPIRSISFDGKLKRISAICCAPPASDASDATQPNVWLGTEGGNVYPFDLQQFAVREPVIYHDAVLEHIPATAYKLNPGAVEAVRQLPATAAGSGGGGDANASAGGAQLLIAYNRGLAVQWDVDAACVRRHFVSPGHGQSVGVYVNAAEPERFTWYHADGSYATWELLDEDEDATATAKPVSRVPYGPDPCRAIDALVRGRRGTDELVVFSGGMPRSAYGDRQCVSVHCADGTKTCLDFTSKVSQLIFDK